MKNKLKISLKIFIIILIFAGIIALIPSAVSAWSQSTLKSGVTINYRYSGADYTLANGPEGLYCIYHGAKVGNSKSKYTLKYIIEIEGKNATLYNSSGTQVGSTVKSKKNAKMAYILGGGSWSKKYGTTSTYTARQLAIYSYWNTFVGQWSTLSGYSHSQNKSVSQTTTSKTILSKAETYSESTSSGASATAVTTSLSLKSSEITNNRVGAFKVKYTGTPTLTVYDSDGNKVTNYKIYSSKTSTTALSTIPNNSSFYIWTSDGDVGKIKVSVKSSSVLTATIYIISHSNKQDLIAVDTGSTSTNAEVEIPVTITKVGDLKVIKTDKTTGKKITGMKFKVQTSNGWLQQTSSGWKYNATFANATEFEITKEGGYTLEDLKVSIKYKVWETETASEYYVLTDQETYSSDYNAVDLTGDTWITLTTNDEVEAKYTNISSGDLTVIKLDKDTQEKLIGMEFKVRTSKGSNTWLQETSNGYNYEATFEDATVYTITSESGLTIEKLRVDITYQIWETKVPNDDYSLSEQENYDSTLNAVNLTGTDNWESVSSGTTVKVNYTNEATYISISGYVWVDEAIDKDNTKYDDLMDNIDGYVEAKVANVIVYLKNKDGDVIATTNTNTDGYYLFDRENKYVRKNQIENYYIEFDYSVTDEDGNSSIKTYREGVEEETIDGTEFIPVAFNSEKANSIVYNGSRALMDEVAYKDVDLTGLATTYTGTDSDDETSYGLSGNLFDKLYNEETYTLEYINLGLVPIYDPDYEIKENLAYVKIVVNGYEYMYEYGYTEMVGDDDDVTVPTVSFQDGSDITLYTRYMYPSDLAQAILTKGESLQVYVVYAITIKNTETYSVDNRYVEQKLCITSLTNTFDTTRYKLNTEANTENGEAMNNTEEAANDDFGSWSSSVANDGEDTSTTTYQGEQIELDSNESETVYIQFEVTLEGITEILANPDGVKEENPTEANTDGYHIYKRNDYSWTNGIYKEEVEHETSSKTKTSSAPYLVFKLPEDDTIPESSDNVYLSREISGVVFEDADEESEDDETNQDALGDGQYDSENESVVENVTVALLDSDENEVYKYAVYNKKDEKYYLYYEENYWEYDSEGNITKVTDINLTSKDALITATTDDSGSYTLSGMVPGEYTLKFTYYDENNTNLQTTINGNKISINDYKSTIVTSSVAKNALGYDTNSYDGEWYKYLEDDNYSVAVDDLGQREDYNEKYYEALYDDEKSVTTTIMEASTAEFDITVEDTTDTSHLGYTTTYYITGGETRDEKPTDTDNYETITSSWYIVGGTKSETAPSDTNDYIIVTDSFFAYEYTGFNFGIITQPVQSLDIDKVITNVKLVNDPTILFDGNPQTGDLDGVSDLDGDDTNKASTYTRIEVEENEMYGSTFTVTYEITITNTSQINYYETDSDYYGWYYMFGEKDLNGDDTDGTADYSEIVYIDIETLLDYLDYDLTLSGSIYEVATDIDGNETTSELVITDDDIAKTTITTERQNDEFDVTQYTISDQLTPVARTETGSSDVVKLTATKVLSTSEDDMAYSNVGEIIKARNSDKDGNVSDTTSIKLVRTPILPDKAEAYVTISPPTGGDTSTILIYVIAGLGMLMVLSIGIVIIKKKIL